MKVATYANLLIAAFMAASGLVAHAASPEARLSIYREQVRDRSSGVYEIEENLYVHVRAPQKGPVNMNRAKLKAALQANDLLKRWAIDYTASEREKADTAPEGVKLAAKIADACNSAWRFNDWNLKFKGQELAGQEPGFVLLGQVVSKADIVRQIPPSFSQAIPQDVLFRILPSFVRVMRNRDAAKLYGMCGAIDLMADAAADQKVKDEFERVNAELDKYLATSEFVATLKERAKKIRGPIVVETWEDVLQKPTEEVSNFVAVVTNAVVDVNVATNALTRAQTDAERKAAGISSRGEVDETARISDEAEIVETRTVTVVKTFRKIRRKTVREVSGNPLFEDAFISCGKKLGNALAQTEIGKKAVAAYFDNVTPMGEKARLVADALSENPSDSQLWNLYGRCLLQEGEGKASLVCFRCALKLNPDDQYALVNAAIAYSKLDCPNLARGLAVLARGLAEDRWCIEKSEEILFEK